MALVIDILVEVNESGMSNLLSGVQSYAEFTDGLRTVCILM